MLHVAVSAAALLLGEMNGVCAADRGSHDCSARQGWGRPLVPEGVQAPAGGQQRDQHVPQHRLILFPRSTTLPCYHDLKAMVP